MARSLRLTSSSSSFSPVSVPLPPPDPTSDFPRPTLGDIPLMPRRPLRDGRSSRGSSVSSTSSRGSRHRKISPRRPAQATRGSMTRGRMSARGGSSISDNDDYQDSEYTPSDRTTSPLPARQAHAIPAYNQQSRSAQPRRSPSRPGNLLTMVDELVQRHHPNQSPITVNSETDASSVGSSTSFHHDEQSDRLNGARRFTAQEKGKGRAMISPIEITDEGDSPVEEGDQSIQILGEVNGKRKRAESDMDLETESENMALAEVTGKRVDEDDTLGSYTCPVCFCAPERAVMTLCGHVFCAKCLLESLMAAIMRNPNPWPGYRPQGRGIRGQRGRGRGKRNGPKWSTQPERYIIGGPATWTPEALRSAWYQHLLRDYHHKLGEQGVERDSWDLIMETDPNSPKEDNVVIKEELKGLWLIDERHFVVEGECPVCRKAIPGGLGPARSGIGGVVPIQFKIGGGKN